MNKFVYAAAISTFAVTAAIPTTASAAPAPLPVIVAGTSSAAGAWVAGGIIGVAAFLDGYDLLRRTTCIGDPLGLGGPGFSEPMPATGNIMIPQCKIKRSKR